MDFATRLRDALTLRNVSTKQLADALGVSSQAVTQVLSGSSKALTAANAARAAQFLSVSFFWLATGEGAMEDKPSRDEMALTQQERDIVIALRVLLPTDRERLIADILAHARDQVRQLEEVMGRNKPTSVIPLRR